MICQVRAIRGVNMTKTFSLFFSAKDLQNSVHLEHVPLGYLPINTSPMVILSLCFVAERYVCEIQM